MDAWQIVALLGCVIMVYAGIFMRKQDSVDHTEILSEVDQTLQHYVTEIMDSNRKVINHGDRMKQEMVTELEQWQDRVRQLEQDLAQLREQLTVSSDTAELDEDKMTSSDAHIHDRYGGLIEMHRQGLSTNEIVKKTGMNHGEVKFILQLAAREES